MNTIFFKVQKEVSRDNGYSGKEPKEIFYNDKTVSDLGKRVTFSITDAKKRKLKFIAKSIARYEESVLTGILSDAIIKTLNRKIGQHKSSSKIKIGITSRDPKTRFTEHLSAIKWNRMIVLYKTSSEKNVKILETMLIEKFKESLTNDVGGGGGDLSNGKTCHLYVIMK